PRRPRPRASCRDRRGCGRAPPDRRGASREAPELIEISAPVPRFPEGPGLLVGAAHRAVVAVPAGTPRGHRRKEALGERATDDLDDLARPLPALVVERHDALLEAAIGRAEVEPSRLDRFAEEPLADERVEDRLQH